INTNGFIATKQPEEESSLLTSFPPSFGTIALFLADLDTSDGVGKVYLRQDSSPDTLQLAAQHISRAFPEDDEFIPTHAVVVTWQDVAAYQEPRRGDQLDNKKNTFQVVLASGDKSSYAILLYPRDGLHFTSTRPKGADVEQPARAAFSKGLEKYLIWGTRQGPVYSITSDNENSIRELFEHTNSGKRGVWVYEIGTSPYFSAVAPGEVTGIPAEAPREKSHGGYDDEAPERVVNPGYGREGQQQVVEYPPYEPYPPQQPAEEQRPAVYEEPEPNPGQEVTGDHLPVEPYAEPIPIQPVQFEPPVYPPDGHVQQPLYPPEDRSVVIVDGDLDIDANIVKSLAQLKRQLVQALENSALSATVLISVDSATVFRWQCLTDMTRVFSYNSDTCANSRQKCSIFADCRDYPNGYCCHCRPGYYGNGKQCLAEGKPQRMNGKVSGRVYVGSSPVPIEFNGNDLHSYVVANDGRAYVAISTIPQSLGPALLPLSSLGGVIGWAFALEQPGYENGFSIIGGEFTRQAEVIFLPGNERLSIKQEFKGIDEHEHLVVSTELEGRLPDIQEGSTVQIEPYSEIYHYSSNMITSSSTRSYTITLKDGNTQTRSYQWRQTITFQGCSHDEATRAIPSTQQLSVSQIFVMYDSGNNLIRYAMSNKIGSLHGDEGEENACFTGTHRCDTNAVCRAGQGNQFTCECASGFRGDGRTCYDIDECRETPQSCGHNAVCNNQPGTFRCECVDGYQFGSDGQTCVEVDLPIDHCQAGTHECDIAERAQCSYTGGSSYICSCLPGFVGDGSTCRGPSCFLTDIDECQPSRCHQEAFCYNTQGSFTCRCRSGFYGDGFQCIAEGSEKASLSLLHFSLHRETAGRAREKHFPITFCQLQSQYPSLILSELCTDMFNQYLYVTSPLTPISLPSLCVLAEREKTPCEEERDRLQDISSGIYPRGPRPGLHIPSCDSQGNYNPLQCHGSTGHCWCVDRNGQEIPGTRAGPGSRTMCIDQAVRPTPVGPTTRPDVHPLPPGTHLLFAQSGKIEYVPLEGHNMKKVEAKAVLHLPVGTKPQISLSPAARSASAKEGGPSPCRRRSRGVSQIFPTKHLYSRQSAAKGFGGLKESRIPPPYSVLALLYENTHSRIASLFSKQSSDYTEGNEVADFLFQESVRRVVIGVAYDCVEKMVYWTDITGPAISKANLQGGEPIPVIRTDLGSPEGLAVDHIGRTLFWTDSMRDKIEVAKLDGSQRRVLIDTDLVNPRAIIADPIKGHLYWADWNRDAPKIETSYMDGTNRRILVKDDLGLPNGLTYDQHSSLLCWADAGTRRVECMNPNQTGRRKVLEGIQYPFGITTYGRNLYYTDWRR
ncbi:NID2 protein, partial [Amia calva]|nr:NID2 protein [Amia calva]